MEGETNMAAVKENKDTTKKGLYDKETYTVMLPLEKDKQADVTVGINGVLYKIQRGVEVEVPASVYEVLMNMQKMDTLAIKRQKAAQGKI